MARYTRIPGSLALITLTNPPVNALSAAVRQGIVDTLSRALSDPEVKGVVLCGENRKFCGGADIREFAGPIKGPGLVPTFDSIEAAEKPVVAAIEGVALGGGLELALACHYRIAHVKARLGLPEVTLGLLPGAGGTQRLPRLTGVPAALDLITTGRHVSAQEALKLGIVDRVTDGDAREAAAELARSVSAERPLALPRLSARPTPRLPDLDALLEAAMAQVRRRARGALAPAACVQAVAAAAKLPYGQGMRKERELMNTLFGSGQARALQYCFFSQRAVGKWSMPSGARWDNSAPRPVRKAAVIGTSRHYGERDSRVLRSGGDPGSCRRDGRKAAGGGQAGGGRHVGERRGEAGGGAGPGLGALRGGPAGPARGGPGGGGRVRGPGPEEAGVRRAVVRLRARHPALLQHLQPGPGPVGGRRPLPGAGGGHALLRPGAHDEAAGGRLRAALRPRRRGDGHAAGQEAGEGERRRGQLPGLRGEPHAHALPEAGRLPAGGGSLARAGGRGAGGVWLPHGRVQDVRHVRAGRGVEGAQGVGADGARCGPGGARAQPAGVQVLPPAGPPVRAGPAGPEDGERLVPVRRAPRAGGQARPLDAGLPGGVPEPPRPARAPHRPAGGAGALPVRAHQRGLPRPGGRHGRGARGRGRHLRAGLRLAGAHGRAHVPRGGRRPAHRPGQAGALPPGPPRRPGVPAQPPPAQAGHHGQPTHPQVEGGHQEHPQSAVRSPGHHHSSSNN